MDQITLDNFRVFGSPASFDLAPVTVLTGKNNSGKSSLIKAFLVLADYLEQDDQTVLRLDGPRAGRHKISSFEQLTNWDNERKQLALGFRTDAYQLSFHFDETLDAFAARLTSFKLVIRANQDELVLRELSQSDQSYQLQVSQNSIDYIANSDAYLNEQRKTYSYEAEQQRKRLAGIDDQIERKKAEFDKNPALLKFQAVASAFAELNKQREDAMKRIKQYEEAATSSQPRREGISYQTEIKAESVGPNDRKLARLTQQALLDYVEADATRKNSSARYSREEQLRNLLRFEQELNQLLRLAVVHIGPNRTYQARLFFNHQTGSEIVAVVEAFVHRGITARSEADKFLRNWLPRFNVGDSVSVSPIEGSAFKITVSRKGSKRAVNLADLGFGAGQILTILLQIASAIQKQQERRDKSKMQADTLLLLIEEPEANLHPQLQSALAELFAELAQSSYNLRFVLETHSEYLIRKLQLLVATQQCAEQDVALYYLDENSQRHINILPDGKLSEDFGSGFFDEADERTMELFRHQKKAARTQKIPSSL